MLLRTHVSTALSLSLVLDNWIARIDPTYGKFYVVRAGILLSVWILQHLIDSVGHTWKTYGKIRYPARNRWHSLPALLAMGLALGMPISALVNDYRVSVIYISVVVLHWIEDLFTESGVYFYKKRIKLPIRVSYDNVVINRATVLLFLGLIPLYVDMFSSKFVFLESMFVIFYGIYAFLVD